MSSFVALPEELQGSCTLKLDTSSAGRFGQVNKACKELVDEQLLAAKAARQRAVVEKVSSRWCEALATMCRTPDGSNLITFTDGGAQLFNCTCSPDKQFKVGHGSSNLALHLGTRQHWNQWRLAAHGEAQPTEAAWLAFGRSVTGGIVERRRV